MLLNHVRSKWRPSWYEMAGSMRPQFDGDTNERFPLLGPVGASTIYPPSNATSPDAMEVDPEPVRPVILNLHCTLTTS